MKILFITSGKSPVPPVKGGAVENLIELLIKDNEEKKNYEIHVISIYDDEAKIEARKYKSCKFIFIDMNKKVIKFKKVIRYILNRIPRIYIGNEYITQIKKVLKKDNKYDVVIVENAPEFGIVLRKLVDKKLILHLHNDFLNSDTKLANEILAVYDNVFTLSNFVNERVRRIQNSNKIQTLYNGVDTAILNKQLSFNDKLKIRQRYGINQNDVVVLYSGRLVPEKGVKELIQAFVKIKEKDNLKLIIAGSAKYGRNVEDSYYKELKKLSENDKEKIIFTGYIKYDDIPDLYSISDIGVVPSIWEEPFALTVIEQMASGNPVIISNSGGMKELVNEGCAIVVERNKNYVENIKNALEYLISNEELRDKMSKNAIEQAKKFDKKFYCDRFDYLINALGEEKHK